MSCEQNYSSDSDFSIDNEENEFVVLNEFPEYKISKTYPHEIFNIKTGHKMTPYIHKGTGYYRVWLNGKNHYLHRVLANQFLQNPNGYKCIDHRDKNKQNYHLENLRFCSHKQNNNNRRNNIIVNEIPDDAIEVESYGEYTFENLYFSESTNRFYFDSGIDFIERKPIKDKRCESYYIHARDINENDIHIYYTKFKKQYNLI